MESSAECLAIKSVEINGEIKRTLLVEIPYHLVMDVEIAKGTGDFDSACFALGEWIEENKPLTRE